jgi:signal transduction histidine kinase
VATFLDFARKPELSMQRVDIGAALQGAAAGRRPQPAVLGTAPPVRADPKALDIVLGVLLSNATEAAGQQGSLRVEAGEENGTVLLRVWDSGAPVPEDERGQIFNPFFTTKPKGMGLGLANALSLADAMGGALALEEDGKTFVLSLEIAGETP